MEGQAQIKSLAEKLSWEVRELSLGTIGEIERIEGAPSPLRFLRDFVLPNKPCIITHAIDHWPALTAWSNAYLRAALTNQQVSVHLTPDGFADAPVDLRRISSGFGCIIDQTSPPCNSHVETECHLHSPGSNHYVGASAYAPTDGRDDAALDFGENSLVERCAHVGHASSTSKEEKLHQTWFATAHVERVPFSTALDLILHSEIGNGVAYAQQQNGCFLSEYGALAADAETHLPWATEAFGCLPEAVNLWIGNDKAVTSFHKDHYENLYAVIAGEKHFTLLPPTDVHRLCIRKYPSACYVKREGNFFLRQERPNEFVPWVSVNPYPPPELATEAKRQFAEYFNGPRPFTCTLQAGEILYLPSMWFHHVRQSPDAEGRTIALNFWYDMQFDVKYAYFNFLESVTHKS